MEETIIEETMSITAANGVRFNVRILRNGARYGADHVLTWEEDRPGVEFYDTRYPHTEFGQFTGGRYYVDTILGRDGWGAGIGGLDLDGGIPAWRVDAESMTIVRAWLRHETA